MKSPIVEKSKNFNNPNKIIIDNNKIKVSKSKRIKIKNNEKLDKKTYEAEKCIIKNKLIK
jgi:hypothetical protein